MTNINNMRGRITPTPPLPYLGSGAAVPAYTQSAQGTGGHYCQTPARQPTATD
ncbi:TPA: hypothetical protein ACPY94_003700 [Yersinia enterocolitica]